MNPAYDATKSNSVCPRCRRTECPRHRKITPTTEMKVGCRRAMLDACAMCKAPGFERERVTARMEVALTKCYDCAGSRQHYSMYQTHAHHACVTCDGTGERVQ